MNLSYQHSSWPDAKALQEEADLLRGSKIEQPTAIEEALRAAYRIVAADLDLFAKNSATKVPSDYERTFGEHLQEKLGAILLLAKYTVLDLAHFHRDIADIERSHGNLALFAETLFRTGAADALIYLYTFAQENAKSPSLNPRVWQNVASHSLMLLAIMESQRERVVRFLAHSPAARAQMEQLISFTRPDIVGKLFRQSAPGADVHEPLAIDAPPYLRLLDRLDPGLPLASALGVASMISAQHRVAQAFEQNDLATALRWFIEGSVPATREVIRLSRGLPSRVHREFCEEILTKDSVHPVRLAAVVRELGERNRQERSEGGIGETNRLLYQMATTRNEELAGVAQLAVRELGTVNNDDALLILAEEAPLLPAAECVVDIMKEHRRLLRLQQTLVKRAQLIPAYRRAQAELQEIEKIMEMVWACDDQEMIAMYVRRLQALHA